MEKENLKQTLFNAIANRDELLLNLANAIHGAKISKGNNLEGIVRNLFLDAGISAEKGKRIKFTDVSSDIITSQSNGYKVDVFVKTKNEILLIDVKSQGWNNNTPMYETIVKYIKAKKEIEAKTNKKVRFILLKNSSNEEHLVKLHNQSIEYGIEILNANKFMSKIANKNINLDDLSDSFLWEQVNEKFLKRIG